MMTLRLSLALLAALVFVAAGCGSSRDFNEDRARTVLEAKPIHLDGEQVSLASGLVDCGVKEDLWEAPTQTSQDRSSARLTAKGRDLKFSDDVLTEPGYRQPYVQVRGDFTVAVDTIVAIHDGPESGTKLVDAKAGAKVDHTCFSNPLPIMGVKKGAFREDVPAVFLYRLADDGWHVEKLVH